MAGDYSIAVRLPDEETYEIVRTILSYESVMRSRPIGQTFAALVAESVDIGAYPPEVRERLNDLVAKSGRRAIRQFLEKTAGLGDDDGPRQKDARGEGGGGA